jgi:small-conductance mechanosensitive channel
MDFLALLQSSEFWATVSNVAWAIIIGAGSVFARRLQTQTKNNKQRLQGVSEQVQLLTSSNSLLKNDNDRIRQSYENLEELLRMNQEYSVRETTRLQVALATEQAEKVAVQAERDTLRKELAAIKGETHASSIERTASNNTHTDSHDNTA